MGEWCFNRGEWTEAYVFLKLLGDGRIYGANDKLEKDELTYIDVINIIRDEVKQYLRFERFLKEEIGMINAVDANNYVFKVVTAPDLQEKASYLYRQICRYNGADKQRKMSITDDLEDYLKSLGLNSPKANLTEEAKKKYGAKTDIIVTTEDSFDHSIAVVGFSIKSHLGSSPTLFNCSSTSGFIFKVEGCTEEAMHKINLLDSLKTIIKKIRTDYSLEFVKCKNDTFAQNISVVDSQMEKILGTAVLLHSGYYSDEVTTSLSSISDNLITINPISVKNPKIFYPAKLKDFLFASFAGMTASSIWNGRKLLAGGYIDVSKDGNMLYYRAISDDVFCNYLMQNTYFDKPDRGYLFELAKAEANAYMMNRRLTESERNSIIYDARGQKKAKKGDFGYIYQKDGEYFIDLNFQIRFR